MEKKYIALILALVVAAGILFLDDYRWVLNGYGLDDSHLIADLSKDEQKFLLDNPSFKSIVKVDIFVPKNLSDYVAYYGQFDISNYELVSYVNECKEQGVNLDKELIAILKKDHDPSRLLRYRSYVLSNPGFEISELIKAVDRDVDLISDRYISDIYEYLGCEWFRAELLNSYLDYGALSDEDVETVIRKVNAGTYREFYEDSREADVSKGYLVLVNKYNYLSDDYVPSNLVEVSQEYGNAGVYVDSDAYSAYVKMADAAKEEGYNLFLDLAYRSYSTQSYSYNSYLWSLGQSEADRLSFRPGYSEHQTGLAVEIFTLEDQSAEYAYVSPVTSWLKNNASKYGFILRYPEGSEDLTGCAYEPWHYRYVGMEFASEIEESGLTFDEYCNIYLY